MFGRAWAPMRRENRTPSHKKAPYGMTGRSCRERKVCPDLSGAGKKRCPEGAILIELVSRVQVLLLFDTLWRAELIVL